MFDRNLKWSYFFKKNRIKLGFFSQKWSKVLQQRFNFHICQFSMKTQFTCQNQRLPRCRRSRKVGARWVYVMSLQGGPIVVKTPLKWPNKWVARVITPINHYKWSLTLLTTGTGPSCMVPFFIASQPNPLNPQSEIRVRYNMDVLRETKFQNKPWS